MRASLCAAHCRNTDVPRKGTSVGQPQHSKSAHAVESVQNPGTPTSSNTPLCPEEHHFPWDHAGGPTVHPGMYHAGLGRRSDVRSSGCRCLCSLLALSPKLLRASAAAGGRRPAAPTSLCWPGQAGLLLWLARSSQRRLFNRTSGIK